MIRRLIPLTQGLFLLNAAIWLLFGVISLWRLGNNPTNQEFTLWVVALLMFANVAAMLITGVGLGTRYRRLFVFFGLLVLLGNIILTFTDQFGLFDLLTLLLDLVMLGLLLVIGPFWPRFQRPADKTYQN
jgi:hypothetical protein